MEATVISWFSLNRGQHHNKDNNGYDTKCKFSVSSDRKYYGRFQKRCWPRFGYHRDHQLCVRSRDDRHVTDRGTRRRKLEIFPCQGYRAIWSDGNLQHTFNDLLPWASAHGQLRLKMRSLRDTQAKFSRRIKFWGVEGGVLPVVISASVSALLISIAAQSGSIPMACLGALPFVMTFGYLLIFVTGRRPHFTRDLVCLFLYGRALSPVPPSVQPRHPSKTYADPQNN
jgi:hypothetical protein